MKIKNYIVSKDAKTYEALAGLGSHEKWQATMCICGMHSSFI